MSEEDRIRVLTHMNGDDAPSLEQWAPKVPGKTVTATDIRAAGNGLQKALFVAAKRFFGLRLELLTLSQFLAKYADLLLRETKGEIALDGRRLGFIYRNILANRAVELAKQELWGNQPLPFAESARYVLESSIPIGLNDESVNREEAVHKLEICFDLLAQYFEEGSEIDTVNRVYELFTIDDPMRKAEILLTGNIGALASTKAWKDLIDGEADITLLAYTALQVETHRPGSVPPELLKSLSDKIAGKQFSTESIPDLEGGAIEYLDEIEALLDQSSDLAQLAAFHHVRRLVAREHIRPQDIENTRERIGQDVQTFKTLIEGARAA